ncbi:angiogenic factor with G patch and FHA domains 1 isoform X2 [Ooceraea biroi]|uniref:angiogenic factor with G patch and FHA domains 1 isoform X2 n=1 Tax=Ooceraea biroi TaxID=2015173 RepID=UPI0005BA2248|nr:angiogenic factor with G patch and FHA domains 1 isoform X2 [Ooceraea biroi]
MSDHMNEMHSGSEEGEVTSEYEEDFTEELCNLPHVLRFLNKLRDHIRKQRKKINKLRNKLNEQKQQNLLRAKTYSDHGTQVAPLDIDRSLSQDWDVSVESSSIVDQVKQVAESVLLQTGFVYEETSGMYYDYNTGYYYDTRQGLYYDGNTGRYYYYDKDSNTYKFHSQVQVCENEPTVIQSASRKEEEVAKQGTGKTNKVLDEIDELIKGLSSITVERYRRQALDLAKGYPPCMRIIVKETNLTQLKVGSLFLVTYTGGSLGREGDHSVLIPDINISKHHARFTYDETKKRYHVIDSGSRNGTFLNGKRLSVAKQESEPCEIAHGSIVQIGGTKLLCHIHNGNETCGHCEPGLVQQSNNLDENKISKKTLHKDELRRLRHKFGIDKDNVTSGSQLASGYQDRAQARRQHVGSSHHYDKTQQSSIHTSITKDNKGFKLLSKMGWSEGRSLGKDGDGRTEPLPIARNHNKVGLGSNEADYSNIELDSNVEKKQAVWRKTQKRYKEIADP